MKQNADGSIYGGRNSMDSPDKWDYYPLTEEIYQRIKLWVEQYGWPPRIAASHFNVKCEPVYRRLKRDGLGETLKRNPLSTRIGKTQHHVNIRRAKN